MTQLVIDVGTAPNDGLGDPIRTAYQKCNTNFSELFSRVQTSVPPTLVGSVGDTAGMYAYDSTYFYYCFANYTGNSTVWGQVTDSADLTLTNIVNGNSNVNIATANGNITVAVTGTSNVLVFANTGAYVTGVVSASGNVTGGNILTAGLISATGNITGGNLKTSATLINTAVSTSGNVTGGNLVTAGLITATGNIQAGNVRTAGLVSATGNVNGGNIISAALVQGVTLSATGNVQGGNLRTAGLISATGAITGGSFTVGTGNITGGNLILSGAIVDSAQLDIQTSASNANIVLTPNGTGNVNTSANVSVTGNITGNNINSTTTFKLAVFANATVRDSSISSPVAGMMIYVTGTGMQVRGATSWNTVAGTGT